MAECRVNIKYMNTVAQSHSTIERESWSWGQPIQAVLYFWVSFAVTCFCCGKQALCDAERLVDRTILIRDVTVPAVQ